jgi:hypothetical protein
MAAFGRAPVATRGRRRHMGFSVGAWEEQGTGGRDENREGRAGL